DSPETARSRLVGDAHRGADVSPFVERSGVAATLPDATGTPIFSQFILRLEWASPTVVRDGMESDCQGATVSESNHVAHRDVVVSGMGQFGLGKHLVGPRGGDARLTRHQIGVGYRPVGFDQPDPLF